MLRNDMLLAADSAELAKELSEQLFYEFNGLSKDDIQINSIKEISDDEAMKMIAEHQSKNEETYKGHLN